MTYSLKTSKGPKNGLPITRFMADIAKQSDAPSVRPMLKTLPTNSAQDSAAGDGVADDGPALQAILDSNNGEFFHMGGGTYKVDTGLSVADTDPIVMLMDANARFTGSGDLLSNVSNTFNKIGGGLYIRMVPNSEDNARIGAGNAMSAVQAEILPDADVSDAFSVAGYFGAIGPPGAGGDIWGLNPLVDMKPGYTGSAIGVEADLNNFAGDGKGVGVLITGVGDSEPLYGTQIDRGAGGPSWQVGVNIDRSKVGVAINGAEATSADQGVRVLEYQTAYEATWSDASAAVGPLVTLIRDSASPAASDSIGAVRFVGKNTTPAQFIYAEITSQIGAPTASSEAGFLLFNTANTTRLTIGTGLQVGAPTGGDKGLGTANFAADVYKNNSAYTNPDYALEHYFTGKIKKYAGNEGASDYAGLMPLGDLLGYMAANHRLPGITDEPAGMFRRGDVALEKIEEAHLYIIELHKRIEVLEGKVNATV